MLPRNVIVQEKEAVLIEIAAVKPMASLQAVLYKDLMGITDKAGEKLKRVVEHL